MGSQTALLGGNSRLEGRRQAAAEGTKCRSGADSWPWSRIVRLQQSKQKAEEVANSSNSRSRAEAHARAVHTLLDVQGEESRQRSQIVL